MMKSRQQQLFDTLSQAVVDMNDDAAKKAADIIVSEGFDSTEAIEIGLGGGMAKAGELYEAGEYFIPDLLVCADTAQKAADVLQTGLMREPSSKGRVVIGTIFGDTHDLGKNIAALFMASAGYEVFDLGKDVTARRFLDEAVERKADVIAISAQMTTTMKNLKDVIDLLHAEYKRSQFYVIIGGKPVSHDFAKKIGADGYAENAVQAVKLLNYIKGDISDEQEN